MAYKMSLSAPSTFSIAASIHSMQYESAKLRHASVKEMKHTSKQHHLNTQTCSSLNKKSFYVNSLLIPFSPFSLSLFSLPPFSLTQPTTLAPCTK